MAGNLNSDLCYLITTAQQISSINGIITVYIRMIINIFLRPEFYHGSMHLYDYMMQAKLCLDQYGTEYFEHLKKYFITHNGFWFHPENVLTCVAVNPKTLPVNRRKATNILLKIKPKYDNRQAGEEVRIFETPKLDQINYNATNVFSVLKWRELPETYVTFPPFLSLVSSYELKENLLLNNLHEKLPRLLCHSQPNEGLVKWVTESVTKNIGKENQVGNLVSKINSREKFSCKVIKKDNYLQR